MLRSFLILFTLVAAVDALAFGGQGRVFVTYELRHLGHVIREQDWEGFV